MIEFLHLVHNAMRVFSCMWDDMLLLKISNAIVIEELEGPINDKLQNNQG